MDALFSDLRFAARALARRPGFATVAVATLALGIGANTAIFSIVHAVLLKPLPYRDPGGLVWVTNRIPQFDAEIAAGGDYLAWRDEGRSFAEIAAFDDSASFTLTGRAEPERLAGARVSASFLPVLGVEPARGRRFRPEEDRLNGGRPALLTDGAWRRLFGADAPLDGQALILDGEAYTAVGVLPPAFAFPGNPDVQVLVPLALDEAVERGRTRMSILQVVGRLRPGVAPAQAREELQAVQTQAREAALRAPRPVGPPSGRPGGPGPGGGGRSMMVIARAPEGAGSGGPGGPGGPPRRMPETEVAIVPLHERLVGDVRPALLILLGAVGLVLLVACANVAHLLLARATARQREIGIRAALGAGRSRMARHLLTESALLGLAGGACGLALAAAGTRLLVARMPADLARGLFRQTEVGLSGPVLLFTLAVSLATGLLFGLAPALAASRLDLVRALREAGGRSSSAARRLLVAAEVALACVLLVGAGLLVRSFLRLQTVDPGFSPARVLTLALDLSTGYPAEAAQGAFFAELARRVRALPGVEAAAFGDALPLSGMESIVIGLRAEGREPDPPDRAPRVTLTVVSPDYFRTMRVPLLAGRAIGEADGPGAAEVAVVSRAMARRFWGNADPLGKRFRIGPEGMGWITVVGVATDVKHEGLDDTGRIEVYRPFLQRPRPFGLLAVRAQGDPTALIAAVRREVRALDPNLPLWDVATMDQRLAASVAERRFNTLLLGLFAALALVLAAIGLYGVLAYGVAERRREIGVRMALGAARRDVLALVVGQGLAPVAAGAAVGLAAALAAGRLLAGQLYAVGPADPATFAAIPLVLLAAALAAAYLPARRATRVDPATVLREE